MPPFPWIANNEKSSRPWWLTSKLSDAPKTGVPITTTKNEGLHLAKHLFRVPVLPDLLGLAVYFFVRSLKDGYWTRESENTKYHVFENGRTTMEPTKEKLKDYADGWITERTDAEFPPFLKLAYIVIAAGSLAYFLIYMYGETTSRSRTPGPGHERRYRGIRRPDVRDRRHDRDVRSHSGGLLIRQVARLTDRHPMENGFYEVRVPDATDYWIEMVKCRHACPVHTDACGYVTAIADGQYEAAYRIARAHNPFASICGRVCGAPCEASVAGAMSTPPSHPPAQALRHRALRSRNRRLRGASRGQQ